MKMKYHREEIVHKDAKLAKRLFPIIIILMLFILPIPILFIKSGELFIGIVILTFIGSTYGLFLYKYFYQLQFTTIFNEKHVVLHSIKRDISIDYNDIICIQELRHITIETQQKKYKITTANGQVRNKIVIMFIERGFKVYSKKGLLINDQPDEVTRRKEMINKFVSKDQYRLYLFSKKVVYSSMVFFFVPL